MKLSKIYKSAIFLKSIFVVSIFAIFFISAVTFKHISLLDNSSKWVNHSYDINLELERLMSYIKDAETGQRGFLITKDSTFLVPYIQSKNKINQSFAKVKKYTKDNPAQENNLRKLEFYISKRQNYLSLALHLSLKKSITDKEVKEKLVIGKQTMDSIRNQVDKMILFEKKTLKGRELYYKDTIKVTPIFVYITLLITLMLISISYIRITRDLEKLQISNNSLVVLNESNNLAEIVGSFGSWQLNVDTKEYTFSDNSYRLLGYEPKAFFASQENFMKYIHPDDLSAFRDASSKMIENGTMSPFTYRVIRKDKKVRYFRTTARIVTNKSGEEILIGTTSDVTEEVLASLSLEQQNIELEASNKELVAFNYVASHDLQEPLRKIQTFVSRLADKEYDNLSESGKEFMTRINNSVERMRILIDDLLQYSRTTKIEKVFESTDLNDLFENAKSDLLQSIEEKNAVIKNEKLPTMTVIPFQIQQLFANLIGNSLKYSKADIAPKIKISCKRVIAFEEELIPKKTKDKFYKITFTDNGIGFEQEYAEKIFILFNRLHNKNEYVGTGIGLAICKKIVENHKGFIFAEGKPNVGATFTIYLPEDNH
ncbi:CHASE3 domain-containing protein [Flavobacterium sp. AS60]|uniref:sensor histidine kinase n=1 Tax=Flavobacterium anseongense TaxID=2910677 RepID=UPI001F354E2E|nr:CHASE3 domain-containing protein [Flavobacterium sp. AS60]MCF6128749.1 CHASE3 domain-containing protein [Flavobacterium sp. AS60]